jgi:hypothetical protein
MHLRFTEKLSADAPNSLPGATGDIESPSRENCRNASGRNPIRRSGLVDGEPTLTSPKPFSEEG